ncbi:hypothetical protein G7054_g908 [Neopestalotiopsis clavispora]|nr:hypothetical protein G7054_g908 [Neopestalotiopsis clavispora]
MTPPLITLEEHFLSESADDALRALYSEQVGNIPELAAKLSDLGPIRLRSMDENNVSMQVISHGPGPMQPAQCCAANDQLAAAVKANPDRFAGFAVLPVSDPDEAAKELTRCVRELGFVGALIDNRCGNTYYDGAAYRTPVGRGAGARRAHLPAPDVAVGGAAGPLVHGQFCAVGHAVPVGVGMGLALGRGAAYTAPFRRGYL